MQAAPQAGATRRLSIRFVGSGSEYFRIWIVNLLLTIVTLGLYYPFARVRRLRYFHGATEVDGHPLSFHAEPSRMFRGYLLVVALFAVYGVAAQLSATAGAMAFALVALVWPALWHSSLRFRLANTGWRGMRLFFSGSLADAYVAMAPAVVLALAAVGFGALVAEPTGGEPGGWSLEQAAAAVMPVLILLASPALLWRLRRYQHDHLGLGDQQTRFTVSLGSFYGVAWRATGLWLALLLPAAFGFALSSATRAGNDPAMNMLGLLLMALGLVIFFVGLQAVVAPYAVTRLQNLVWNGTRSRYLEFESRLQARAMVRLAVRNVGFTLVTLGLYIPFAAVATARLRLEAVSVCSDIAPETLVARAAGRREAAAGDAAGDLAGIDLGL